MRISDWISDVLLFRSAQSFSSKFLPATVFQVCSTSVRAACKPRRRDMSQRASMAVASLMTLVVLTAFVLLLILQRPRHYHSPSVPPDAPTACCQAPAFLWRTNNSCAPRSRSEEHTSELQSLMRISYAVIC